MILPNGINDLWDACEALGYRLEKLGMRMADFGYPAMDGYARTFPVRAEFKSDFLHVKVIFYCYGGDDNEVTWDKVEFVFSVDDGKPVPEMNMYIGGDRVESVAPKDTVFDTVFYYYQRILDFLIERAKNNLKDTFKYAGTEPAETERRDARNYQRRIALCNRLRNI
jgi:hypothetical protein